MKDILILMRGIVMSLLCLGAGCQNNPGPESSKRAEQPSDLGTIVAVGDSLTAGYGVKEEDAYTAQLERKLRAAGYRWRVINAGISGETSSGALSRINWVLTLKPDIVILETGANDGLRGIDPRVMKGNISEIVRILKKNNVKVVLAGMRMLTNMGREYTEAFSDVYQEVSRKEGLILIPFFLAGVVGDPTLNQSDGIHPFPEGYRIVTETVYPYLLQAIGT